MYNLYEVLELPEEAFKSRIYYIVYKEEVNKFYKKRSGNGFSPYRFCRNAKDRETVTDEIRFFDTVEMEKILEKIKKMLLDTEYKRIKKELENLHTEYGQKKYNYILSLIQEIVTKSK